MRYTGLPLPRDAEVNHEHRAGRLAMEASHQGAGMRSRLLGKLCNCMLVNLQVSSYIIKLIILLQCRKLDSEMELNSMLSK